MTAAWGRFTVRGDDELERRIAVLVGHVGRVLQDALQPDQFRALVLIGGYGRGEGGVERRDGLQHPHNNLDFLLITKGGRRRTADWLSRQVDPQLRQIETESGVGIDVSTVSERKLLHSPCLVMWYDMRHGHKTILGDSDFVPSLRQFSVDRIEPQDIRWLLVNRGSQLIVNDLLMQKEHVTQSMLRYIIRLSMKAIIGYGDALLYFLDEYHWSYREKAQRMAQQTPVCAEFRKLYAEAVEFRFQPDYAPYLRRNLSEWSRTTRELLQDVHRVCESKRMRTEHWSWAEYPLLSLRKDLLQLPSSMREAGKRLVNICRGPKAPPRHAFSDRIAYRAAGHRGLLPVCYPTIVYDLQDQELREWTRLALGAPDAKQYTLALRFLEGWGRRVDPNFFKTSRRLGLPLGETEAVA